MFGKSVFLNNISSQHVLYIFGSLSHHPGNDTMHCHCFFLFRCHRIPHKSKNDQPKIGYAHEWEEKTTKLLIFKAIQLTGKRQHCYLSFFLSFFYAFSVYFIYFRSLYSQKYVFVCGFSLLFFFLDKWITFDVTTLKWRRKKWIFFYPNFINTDSKLWNRFKYRFDSSSSLLLLYYFVVRVVCVYI